MEKKINNLPAIVSKDNIDIIISEENSLRSYLRKINLFPSLTQEEEFMLAKAYLEENDMKAAHRLITSHLKLVAKLALSYKYYNLPIIEVISEGNLGLIHAVKKYDPDLGYRLSTYAMWWIKASIQEYILRSWSLVKIGTTSNQKKLFFNLKKIKNKLRALHSREIGPQDYEQISYELGVSKQEVAEIDQRLSQSDTSLNNPMLGNDQNDELIDFLPENRPSVEITLSNKQEAYLRKNLLDTAMSQLNDREIEIIKLRRLSEPPKTLDELSKKLNISKERVRQIENRALDKMHQYVISQKSHYPSLNF